MKKILLALCVVFTVVFTASCKKNNPPQPVDPFNGHSYVDLELPSGILWATCNVGATQPEEYGDYFCWGYPKAIKKGEYIVWQTYLEKLGGEGTSEEDCGTDKDPLKDYVFGGSKFKFETEAGTPDCIGATEWDAAKYNWQGGWRMPSYAEFEELLENTEFSMDELNGVQVAKLVSKRNGQCLYFPLAGYIDDDKVYGTESAGYYYVSTADTEYPDECWYMNCSSYGVYMSYDDRY
ncbi:MAG: hypothetical protein HUJ95_03635, partial [Bacteroidales bacterium]|nr:hypothetical protein [Bacteroidales bacterium]